eukprot:scaffold40574_cov27-Tisochrysis_lutea.AAC.23
MERRRSARLISLTTIRSRKVVRSTTSGCVVSRRSPPVPVEAGACCTGNEKSSCPLRLSFIITLTSDIRAMQCGMPSASVVASLADGGSVISMRSLGFPNIGMGSSCAPLKEGGEIDERSSTVRSA